jgi:hypothetical protein
MNYKGYEIEQAYTGYIAYPSGYDPTPEYLFDGWNTSGIISAMSVGDIKELIDERLEDL